MNETRAGHTTSLLPNGEVLVTGGQHGGGTLNSAELYDPSTESCRTTDSMHDARMDHTASTLRNGKVLITGGYRASDYLTSAELYDP
jgi:hypothetical protein